ncbi:MAG: imidazolonepropionase [Oscillospiraceae bacterium]|nr:imidazolonepropionase [Oscillospiraceae bacterium]
MPRQYTKIKEHEKEIIKMIEKGYTKREVAEHFGFKDKYTVKQFMKRYKKNQKKIELGVLPKRRGRPPKDYKPSEADKDNEIKRLKMENELLRDFLRLAERR